MLRLPRDLESARRCLVDGVGGVLGTRGDDLDLGDTEAVFGDTNMGATVLSCSGLALMVESGEEASKKVLGLLGVLWQALGEWSCPNSPIGEWATGNSSTSLAEGVGGVLEGRMKVLSCGERAASPGLFSEGELAYFRGLVRNVTVAACSLGLRLVCLGG